MSKGLIHRSLKATEGTAGFTLIELMIVVAVIGIIAAIAIPSYNDAIRKSRRGQAKADLVEYAQVAERYRTINNTYVGFETQNNLATQSPREVGSPSRYTFRYVSGQSTFTISATAVAPQNKDTCGNLSINQAGVKTNSSGTLSNCW